MTSTATTSTATTSTATTSTATESGQRVSKAVTRPIEAGSSVECVSCQQLLKFRARQREILVICNVYIDGGWDRVERFHLDCYAEAKQPHGPLEA